MKECPFCLENEQEINKEIDEDGQAIYSVRCGYCGCFGPWGCTEDYAKEQWNKRERDE